MGFPRQEYWSGLPFPPPGDLSDPGIKPRSPTLQADSLPPEPPGKPPERLREPQKAHGMLRHCECFLIRWGVGWTGQDWGGPEPLFTGKKSSGQGHSTGASYLTSLPLTTRVGKEANRWRRFKGVRSHRAPCSEAHGGSMSCLQSPLYNP